MLNMMWYCIIIFFCDFFLKGVHGNIIGTNCTLEISGAPGTCKLLMECKEIRDELIKYNRLPQACGFQETQAIVCCPREPGQISEQKCRGYSSLKNRHEIFKRIVGGEKANKKEFPHMARLGGERKRSGKIHWICAGTIISQNYILTAAQCLTGFLYDIKYVRVGFNNMDDPANGQQINVLNTKMHPNYESSIAYNDVGLVKLEEPIRFSSYARPACLFTNFQIPNKEVIVTAWGNTRRDGLNSKELFKVTLELADYEFCNSEFKKVETAGRLERGIVDEEQICVRTETNGIKDTCNGDAGGPLQIYDSDLGMYKVIGVISFGSILCDGRLPTVSTRVSHYIKWIENIVWWEDSDHIETVQDSVEDIVWPD